MNTEIQERLKEALQTYLGYPCNSAYDYSEIVGIFNTHINNVGDPMQSSTYRANTKDIEREVLCFFADLWGIKRESIWAYVTGSGTEGNLQGLYVARESSQGQPHVFFTSKDSHYSIFKIARLLCLNLCTVDSQDNGEIDYTDFKRKLEANKDKYIIVNANLGTTMKGGLDNTREIFRIMKKCGKENSSYIHVDGALTGFYLPFLERDLFFKAHVNSMSISGHKFLGVPFPCGVFMMEKKFLDLVTNNIEYIGCNDCMISGSRSGHSSVFLKYIIEKKGYDGFKKDIEDCIGLAEYAVENIPGAWRNHNSVTVVIPKPCESIVYKWQLATEGDLSHIVVMPHVTKEKLDKFIQDVKSMHE